MRASHRNRAPLRSLSPVLDGLVGECLGPERLNGHGTRSREDPRGPSSRNRAVRYYGYSSTASPTEPSGELLVPRSAQGCRGLARVSFSWARSPRTGLPAWAALGVFRDIAVESVSPDSSCCASSTRLAVPSGSVGAGRRVVRTAWGLVFGAIQQGDQADEGRLEAWRGMVGGSHHDRLSP